MKEKLDLENIKDKLYKKLEKSGWAVKLRSFIYSSDFDNIIIQLAKLSTDGKRFTPKLSNMFRAFEECPVDDLKVVIVGQDPYPSIDVADGIAFSCSQSQKEQPSLRFMLDEVQKMYPFYDRPLDLKVWSNQGVLMFNTALTTEVNKIGQHYQIWVPFTVYLFDYFKNFHPGLVYVFMGKKSQEWVDMCGENCTKFMVSHPASAAYNGGKWDSKGVFQEVQTTVKHLYNYTINW
jgi:uracil-DNA glycosylase